MGVYLTILLYAIISSVFFPVFQSLVFYKSCIFLSNSTDHTLCANKSLSAKNEAVHTLSNLVLLASGSGLCITAFFTSRIIGRISDSKSRKLAILIPFIGLIISDITVIIQVVIPTIPPYFFIFSEIIFGLFGGYMSITSSAFAIISSYHKNPQERAKAIARLEGTVSFGSMIGFLISSQLDRIDYLGMSIFVLIAHLIAVISALAMDDIEVDRSVSRPQTSIFSSTEFFNNKPDNIRKSLRILYFSFAISYFAFIGSTRILFFYLKHKFYWGNEKFGYLKALNQAATTFMAFLLFPFLRSNGWSDVTLAIFGLTTRSIGRAWYAFAWNDAAVFSVVFFEMFSKFPATALRSLISSNVKEAERGVAFSFVAVIEAFCNLTSSIVFHLAFPLSLSFFPELSFVIMPIIIIPAIVLMWKHRKSLESTDAQRSSELGDIPTEAEKLT